MSFSWRSTCPFLILLLAGCRSWAPTRSLERVAILPFENLTGDRSLDWLGRGVQVVLNRQLSISRTVAGSSFPDLADATLGHATRYLHGTIEKRGGALRLEAYLEDAATHRQVGERMILTAPLPQLLPGLDRMAHSLAADVAPPPVTRPEALEAYVAAVQAPQPDVKAALLAKSAELDPKFVLPLISLSELNLTSGKRDEAQATLRAAAARSPNALEREQIAALTANLTPDTGAQAAALQKMSEAGPLQANLQLFVANALQRLRQFLPAIAAYERALRVDPDNADAWNRLGYLNAYAGRLPQAKQALETYQRLAPNTVNPLDSLGEVHYVRQDFKAATDYFQAAFAKSPQFEGGRAGLKAAYARLLAGQFKEADQAFEQYAKLLNGQPAAVVAKAHYLYASGSPQEAFTLLAESAAKAPAQAASVFHAHRCGLLLKSDRAGAQAAARAALAAAPNPVAALCQFLSLPSASVAEWTARVARVTPEGPVRRQSLAYALFFDGHYADAFPLLEEVALESSQGTDSEVRVWLAESQWRSGRWASARDSYRSWPLPPGDSIFTGRAVASYVFGTLSTGAHFEDRDIAQKWDPHSVKMGKVLN